jgi:hypothetical protein
MGEELCGIDISGCTVTAELATPCPHGCGCTYTTFAIRVEPAGERLRAWFAEASMDATACRACLAVPRALPAATAQMQALQMLAGTFDVSVGPAHGVVSLSRSRT